ncbi:Response regulator receiver domain-containing protein [Halopelagius inordinatus]|uniref:Response regulator receiver domain-containing protein n=1 Tax=Halopelagius inordinatus TaxID=553467 RepID=A0A1I2T8G2_9EURY|nr:response regulator [Halopelagius inordinatus]SFG58846.1 Response regulator receiver domain-containing protein [Halopelagius inordinatus]
MSEATPVEILLVEDNPGDVRLTREAFKDGCIENALHVAGDGVEALDFLYQRGDHEDAPRPDIVLLDLNLPRKNGDEILEEIRNDPDLKRIPVIVLTSSTTHEDVVNSYDLSANAYLTKPVDPDEFMDTVRVLEEFWFSIVRLPDHDE